MEGCILLKLTMCEPKGQIDVRGLWYICYPAKNYLALFVTKKLCVCKIRCNVKFKQEQPEPSEDLYSKISLYGAIS